MSDGPPVPAPETPSPTQARRLALAFQELFGQPERRSSSQRMVVAHLRERCGRDSAIFQPDKIGAYDPLRAAHKDGAQTQYLIIKRQLAVAAKLGLEPKKVVSKR